MVKRTESGNFIVDMRKMLKSGRKLKVFASLFDGQHDFDVLEKAVKTVGLDIVGIIKDESLLKCRNISMHDKINAAYKNCGYDSYVIDEINVYAKMDVDVVIVVNNKYTYIQKIVNVLENKGVECILYHISDLKHKVVEVNKDNGHLPLEGDCCGCGACVNICPTQAITMQYSEHDFLIPKIDNSKCINCNLCTNTCPSLNPNFSNEKEPKFYSFCASDEIRKKSSSGGMFTLLSRYVLEHDGYVCGAAFDENMKVRHIIVSDEKGLDKIRGSKYVQSDMGQVYKKIKELLDSDKHVLFTGTPCQIAGMKAFLKKEYDKLITAEVLCHGVPSQKFFDNYIEEKSFEKKLVNVEFRSKKLGWSFSGMVFYFDDGTEYISKRKSAEKNIYLDAFIDNMMMRDMCYDCMFNDYARQGDFTIGDLWHSDKLDPKSNDRKGTSFVFVNNKKAQRIFGYICAEAKYYKQLDVKDYYKIPNRVAPKTKINPKRERFLDLLKTKSFSEAYEYAVNGRYDIGLPSVMYNDNVGSVLTYYALYNVLSDKKYSVLPIERPLNSELEISEEAKTFVKKWLPSYAQPVQYANINEMRDLNQKCDQFVVGSDQIFLEMMSRKREHFFMLQWIKDYKRRIAFASSFGGPGARGTKDYYRELKYYLDKFDRITCREDDGVSFANNELHLKCSVEWVLDPVFLCDKKHYLKLVESTKVNRKSEFIGAYVIIPRLSIGKLISKTKEYFGQLPVEVLGDNEKADKVKDFSYSCTSPFPIENALELIHNCKYFITDSFHGVCFAIIFRKDFLVIPRDFADRFTSLLNRIGLGDRIVKNDFSNYTEELYKPIDYDLVYEKLNQEIEKSMGILLKSLQGNEVENFLSDYDVVMEYINKNTKQIAEVDDKFEEKLGEIYEMLATLDSRISQLEV